MKKNLVAISLFLLVAIVIGFWLYRNSRMGIEVQADLEFTKVEVGQPLTDRVVYMAHGDLEKPSELKLPENLREGEVVFFEVDLDGHTIYMVGQPGDPPRLNVDTDGDGDLAAETSITGDAIAKDRMFWDPKCFFGPVSVTLPKTEPRQTVNFYAASYGTNMITIHPAGYRCGTIRLGGHEYRIGVLDGDLNGKFEKTKTAYFSKGLEEKCDLLVFDTNQNGEFDWENDSAQALEIRPLAGYFNLNDSYYEVQVAGDGASITLKKIELPMGTLAVSDNELEFMAISDNGLLQFCQSKSQYSIPAGNYRLEEICVKRKDTQGNRYTVTQDNESNLKVSIDPDQTKMCKLGPPFTIKTSVSVSTDGWFFKRKIVSISPRLEGQGGVKYSPSIEKDDQTLEPPKVKIMDEKGEVLSSGKFEYG